MNLVVFGATGGTGRCLVEQGLAAGHRLAALVRRPEAVGRLHGDVSVVAGDVLDPAAVLQAVKGQEAVVWAIGGQDPVRTALSGRQRQREVCTRGSANVLDAMAEHGVRRLVALSSWGAGESRSRMPLPFRLFVVPLLLRTELADKARQEALIRASTADWTIVRPSRLTDGERTGSYRVGPALAYSPRSSISSADVAQFLLGQLSDPTWVHSTVEITSIGGGALHEIRIGRGPVRKRDLGGGAHRQ